MHLDGSVPGILGRVDIFLTSGRERRTAVEMDRKARVKKARVNRKAKTRQVVKVQRKRDPIASQLFTVTKRVRPSYTHRGIPFISVCIPPWQVYLAPAASQNPQFNVQRSTWTTRRKSNDRRPYKHGLRMPAAKRCCTTTNRSRDSTSLARSLPSHSSTRHTGS